MTGDFQAQAAQAWHDWDGPLGISIEQVVVAAAAAAAAAAYTGSFR